MTATSGERLPEVSVAGAGELLGDGEDVYLSQVSDKHSVEALIYADPDDSWLRSSAIAEVRE